MLDQFRSLSGSLPAKLLLLFLVLSFGIWGIGDMLRSQGRHTAIATVGDSSITADEFVHALRRENENVTRMLGDRYSPDLVKSLNLPQQVLRQLISRRLIDLESRSLGLIPGDAEIVQHIRDNPAFQDSKGHFDKAVFEATLKDSGLSEKDYVSRLRRDMASDLLLGTISSAAAVPDIAVRTLYDAQEERRTVTLYTIPASLVENVPHPDEAQLKAYYEAHKSDFTAPEYRTLSYVTISSSDVQPVAISEADLEAAYRERKEDFQHPEQRTVEQLLYNSEDKALHAEALLKSGKSFADVAKETDILNKNAVSLGTVARNAILQNAANAVFALPAGGTTAPIHSPFGWHIFHVSAIQPPYVTPFDKAKPQLEKDLQARSAGDAQNAMADKLQDALAGGSTLQEAASALKLKLYNIGPVDQQGMAPDGAKIKDIPSFDKFLDTAFKTDNQTESSLLTTKNGTYYVLRVDNVIPERLRPLSEVREQVAAQWQKEERSKRLEKQARDIASAFSNSSQRATIISTYELKSTNGEIKRDNNMLGKLALPPALVKDIFRRPLHGSTGAYASGSNDYLIAVVNSINPPPPPDKDAKLMGVASGIRDSLKENIQNEILEEYTGYLAKKYGVSVNEAALQSAVQ